MRVEGAADESKYTTDYYSMVLAEKRMLLPMLNSGPRPSEAARRIAAKRNNVSPTTVDREEEVVLWSKLAARWTTAANWRRCGATTTPHVARSRGRGWANRVRRRAPVSMHRSCPRCLP